MSENQVHQHGDHLAGVAALPASAAGHRERLTITQVELFRVCPPLQPGILPASAAPDFDVIPKFIVKVHTDAGIVGLGETHRMRGGAEDESVARLYQAAEALQGRDVLDFNLARLELPVPTDTGAFECAFYDILGKAVGWPVWRLLGGLAQRRIPVHYWAGKGLSPEELRALAERGAEPLTPTTVTSAAGRPSRMAAAAASNTFTDGPGYEGA